MPDARTGKASQMSDMPNSRARLTSWLAPGMTWRQRLARLRLSLRTSPLQRDWESGDPARVARVGVVAAQVLEELAREG
jgi:hypothetical protein